MSTIRRRFHLAASRTHKWLAVLVGVQLLIWFSSGLLMSALPIERVRGEHIAEPKLGLIELPGAATSSPAAVLVEVGQPVRRISLQMLVNRPVFEVELGTGDTRLHDAITAKRLPPIDASTALAIARAAYRLPAAPAAARWLQSGSTEYRGMLPVWQVSFADAESTRIYVAADTGRITAVRTGTWRLYDFFWGLHIMDWKNHEDFNTPWLIAFAAGALLLALAGTALLFMRGPWLKRKRRR